MQNRWKVLAILLVSILVIILLTAQTSRDYAGFWNIISVPTEQDKYQTFLLDNQSGQTWILRSHIYSFLGLGKPFPESIAIEQYYWSFCPTHGQQTELERFSEERKLLQDSTKLK